MFSNCKRLEIAYIKICCDGYALVLRRKNKFINTIKNKDISPGVLKSKNQFPASP